MMRIGFGVSLICVELLGVWGVVSFGGALILRSQVRLLRV